VQLTLYTDYALRTLLYLGLHPGRPVPVPEVAAAYQVSTNHVAKVAKALVRGGFVKAHRGRTGGLELAMTPAEIKVGAIVRETEPTLELLECFDHRTSSCPITGVCRLERTLHEARAAFLDVLDRTTLADLLSPKLAAGLLRRLPLSPAGKRGR
jgi:Rrf2 family nitric oxide-sensitive transcriptional repressor